MTFDYDKDADVLYVVFKSTQSKCRYIENDDGIIFRVDSKSSEVVGCTIPMFSRLLSHGQVSIPEITRVRRAPELLESATA